MATSKVTNKRVIRKPKYIEPEPKIELSVPFNEDVSDHSQELLWGQGFLATHTNDTANKRIQELVAYNRMEEFFPYLEKLNSLFGNTYVTIDIVDGNPTWTICDPYMNAMGTMNLMNKGKIQVPTIDGTINGMGRAMVTDIAAVVWKRINYGTISFPIKEIWDSEKVHRIFFGENNKRIKIAEVNQKLPEHLQLEEYWYHNLGYVPVLWSKNVATFGARAYPDGYKGASVQAMADKLLCEMWHEAETNRTRIVGNMSADSYASLNRNGQKNQLNKTDFLVSVNMKNSTGATDNQLIPIVADPKFKEYTDAFKFYKDEYFQLAGYSPLGDGSTEKTATESKLMKTADYQTTKKKRNLRIHEITQLFRWTMDIDTKFGFGDIYGDYEKEFTFEIMENKVMDSLDENENFIKMMEVGLMSRVEVIAKQRGINMKEAEAVIKEIDAQRTLDAELNMKLNPQEDKTTDKKENKEGE